MFSFLASANSQNQEIDTSKLSRVPHQNVSPIILPGAMISYGVASLMSDYIREVDNKVQNRFMGAQSNKIDDYLIYAPLAIDISLTAGGFKSKHNIRDKAVIYALSTALNAVFVYPVKSFTSRLRPDMSDTHSFPSGHTSNAFVSAEFFWQEYKHRSKWLASAGYLMAGTTGYYRLKNNKHWLSDVIAGAGIGILSTKLIYAIYPRISDKFFNKNPKFVIIPVNFEAGYGLSCYLFIK